MKVNTVYKKVKIKGAHPAQRVKLEEVGTDLDINYMQDGLWLISSSKSSKGASSMKHLAEMYHTQLDSDDKIKLIVEKEQAVRKFLDSEEYRELSSKGYSLFDLVRCVVDVLSK